MKLLAAVSPEYYVFSVCRHDCRQAPDGTLADGGQPNIGDYAGYGRYSGKTAWIELKGVTYADLCNDWNSGPGARKYGVHVVGDKRIAPAEPPDIESFEWQADNAIWGTYGKDGKGPKKYILMKDCTPEHLRAIDDHVAGRPLNPQVRANLDYWLKRLDEKEKNL